MSIKEVQAQIRIDKGKDLITLPPAQHCLECGTQLKEFEAHVAPRVCSEECFQIHRRYCYQSRRWVWDYDQVI